MTGIIEAANLPEGEEVYLKKDFFGWRVVNPIKNKDGKLVWQNLIFGGKRNLLYLVLLMLFFGIAYLGVTELLHDYKEVAKNPCAYCTTCQEHTNQICNALASPKMPEFNLTLPK